MARALGWVRSGSMSRRRPLRFRMLPLLILVAPVVAACGGSGDDDTPDAASFCLLATLNDPVAQASVGVLQRLDELAPDEVDDSVVVLREAAEEIERHPPGSPDHIATEFEVRFEPDHIAARRQVEAYVAATCAKPDPVETVQPETTEPETTEPEITAETKATTEAETSETETTSPEEELDGTQD